MVTFSNCLTLLNNSRLWSEISLCFHPATRFSTHFLEYTCKLPRSKLMSVICFSAVISIEGFSGKGCYCRNIWSKVEFAENSPNVVCKTPIHCILFFGFFVEKKSFAWWVMGKFYNKFLTVLISTF